MTSKKLSERGMQIDSLFCFFLASNFGDPEYLAAFRLVSNLSNLVIIFFLSFFLPGVWSFQY